MPKHHIIHLPKTDDLDLLRQQSKQMQRMRLEALKLDQKSFYSQYKDEVNQPEEFWLNRLRGKHAHHWMVVDSSSDNQTIDDLSAHGIAFLVVIESDPTEGDSKTSADANGDSDRVARYQMGAIWVDPAYRGNGICTALLKAALAWIKEQISIAKVEKAHVDLGVRVGNDSAREAYRKVGFAMWKTEHLTATNGELYDINLMKLEIPAE